MAAAGLAAWCCSAHKTALLPRTPVFCFSLNWSASPAWASARWKPSSPVFRVINSCVTKSAAPAALPLMTNYRFFTGYFPARPLAAVLVLLLALPITAAQAQGLRPSGSLPRSVPATSAGAAVPRPADFIVAVVNSEPITNNELGPKLLERLISDKAQLQMARASGLRVDDNAVDAAVEGVAGQNQISVDE